jgi:hypothetical protein
MTDTTITEPREHGTGLWLMEIHVGAPRRGKSRRLGRAILGRRDLPPIGTWGREFWAACRIPARRFVWGFDNGSGRYIVLVREPRCRDVPVC